MSYFAREDTLCIDCQKCCNGGCSWSKDLTPVNGWTATETPRGYHVDACPEFVQDDETRGRPAVLDSEGVMACMEAMAKKMREDYISGRGPYDIGANGKRTRAEIRAANRKDLERWLRGKGGALLQLSNPDEVILMLRKMARRYDNELAKFLR